MQIIFINVDLNGVISSMKTTQLIMIWEINRNQETKISSQNYRFILSYIVWTNETSQFIFYLIRFYLDLEQSTLLLIQLVLAHMNAPIWSLPTMSPPTNSLFPIHPTYITIFKYKQQKNPLRIKSKTSEKTVN